MCFGIPGQIVEMVDAEKHIGRVEIQGSTRMVQLGILAPDEVQIGKWVLVNAGLAVSFLEADEAFQLLQFIKELDQQFEEVQS